MKKILCAIPLISVLVVFMMQMTAFAAPSAATVADSTAEFTDEVSEKTETGEGNSALLSIELGIKIGDYIELGTYYGEPILWRCVDIDENGPLMLTDSVIAIKMFDAAHKNDVITDRNIYGSSNWADSNIRAWLNSTEPAGSVVYPCGNSPSVSYYGTINDYSSEAGFLSSKNFTQNELSLIKQVNQKCIISPDDVNENSFGSSRYNACSWNKISDIYSKERYDVAYCEYVTDSVFLLDVKQVYNIYNNADILGEPNGYPYVFAPATYTAIRESGISAGNMNYNNKYGYYLRTPNQSYMPVIVYTEAIEGYEFTCLKAYIDGGIRPAFYLNESASFNYGNGSFSSPFANHKSLTSSQISIGDYIELGTYYGEPILWRCVDIDENGPLMLTDSVIAIKMFDAAHKDDAISDRNIYGSSNWANSNIRAWLNSTEPAGSVVYPCGNSPSVSYYGTSNRYDDESGFLSSENFTSNELSLMKPVNQKCIVSPGDISENCFGTVKYNAYLSKEIVGIYSEDAYNNAYHEYVIDSVFLLDVKQVSNIYNNANILGEPNGYPYIFAPATGIAISESGISGGNMNRDNKYGYFLRTPAEDALPMIVYTGALGGYEYTNLYSYVDGGIRPAFYLNTGFTLVGKGTINTPYTLITSLNSPDTEDRFANIKYGEKNYDFLTQPVYIFEDTYKDVEIKITYKGFTGNVKIYLIQNEEQIVELENGVAKHINVAEVFPLSADYKTPDANTPADVYIHIVNETTGETKIWPTKLKILSDESQICLSPESATAFIQFLTTNNSYTPDESHTFYALLTGTLSGSVKQSVEQAFLAYAYDALGTDVYDNRLNAILDFFADDCSLELKDALYDVVIEQVHEKLLNVGEINDLNDVKTGLKIVLGAISVVAYERDKEEHAYFRTILGVDQDTDYFDKLKLAYPTCKRADMIDDWALFVYEIEQKLALEYKNTEAVSPSTEYQLTFVSNCEEVEDYTYTYDPSKNNWHIPNMVREGYIFGGWYWDAECTSCATGVRGINWDATFYANWIKRYYDVTLESNCDIIDDKVITVDITIGYTIKDLQRNGYVFAGWYKDEALTIAAPYELNPTSDMTLYAKWKPLFSYSVSDDEISITGLLAYVVNDGIEDKNIIIPQTIDGYKVTSIADDAFKNTSITGATVEDGVTSIGANAFSGCSDMTFIYLPLSISSIGNSAFYGCEKLSIQGYPGTYTETYAKQEGISFVALTPAHRTFYTKMWAYLNLESEVTMSVGYKFEYMVDIIPEEHLDRMGLLMWDYASTPEESEAIYENCSNIIAGARYNSADERFETTTDGIAAKNLGDQLSFRAYYLNDDGSYTYSKLISNYSPKTYCYNKINDEPDDEKSVALMVSILNYGAAAQTYFGYNTDNLMNSELSEEQKKITWDGTLVRSDYSIPDGKDSAFVRDASVTSRGGYLNLEGAIDYNFYAKTDSMDPYGATIYYWTEEDIANLDVLTFANASSFEDMTWNDSLERYEGKYEGCAAKEMFDTVYACIVFSSLFGDDDINSGVIGYSPERYAYINQDKEDRNGMLCKYMVVYGDAARSYFAERN